VIYNYTYFILRLATFCK